jgi:exodeoxyribonuclease VIII
MILTDQSEIDYHSHSALSRSRLWTLASRTPQHARHAPAKKSKAMDLGKAMHIAVLEPHRLDDMVMKGGEDRRGNQWKDLVYYCNAYGKIPLTESDYGKVFYMRDAAQALPVLKRLTDGKQLVEHSGYWIDEETGIECRCRPDIYHPGLRIAADLKTTLNASPESFMRSIEEYGYHVQEPFYSEGWHYAGGGAVDGFLFIAIETDFPHVTACYELLPEAVAEGEAVMHKALRTWKTCMDTNIWPGYGDGIMQIDIPRRAYRETLT